jgi:hypothetical protein
MDACFAELLAADPDSRLEPREELIPEIALSPAPESWPDVTPYLAGEDRP